MEPLTVMFFSPLPTAVACAAYFVVEVQRHNYGFKFTTARFLGRVLLWGFASLVSAFFYALADIMTNRSPQGPLAFFFYGPVALSIGIFLGTVMWRRREAKPNRPIERDAPLIVNVRPHTNTMSSRSQDDSKPMKVRLKSFNGTAVAPPQQRPSENYWLLIGEEGVVIESKNEKSRLLIQFSVRLGSLGLQNHNPVPNTLLILESDLESLG